MSAILRALALKDGFKGLDEGDRGPIAQLALLSEERIRLDDLRELVNVKRVKTPHRHQLHTLDKASILYRQQDQTLENLRQLNIVQTA